MKKDNVMGRRSNLIRIMIPILCLLSGAASAQDWRTLVNLKGEWKFELGDDPKWADPKFRDAKWDNIRVPGPWEDEGYPGYDGYAWYRKHFRIESKLRDAAVYLHAGYIDDVGEVYLNGHMVGFEGQFPPDFITAYNVTRPYRVPQQFLNYEGDNVIAVRVYDQRLAGGIVRGQVGLYEPWEYLQPEYSLEGMWKFATGDDPSWKDTEVSDSKWTKIVVPGFWEGQGFRNYDGMAWYRLEFKVPQNLIGQKLVLLLGKIDDFDETYLNGKRIGRTGSISRNATPDDVGNEYAQLRAYTIASNLLLPDQVNVLAVRVQDVYMHGGIYDGPVGFISRQKYLDWKEDHEDRWNPFRWFR